MNEDFSKYDDQAAVAFIRSNLSKGLSAKLDTDKLTYFIDLIYDYYESRGYLDEDTDGDTDVDIDIDIDVEEMCEYIQKNAKRDEIGHFSIEEIEEIVNAEMDYCDSLQR
ncbi:hypothetical protein HQ45_09575 [Porphyromonas crevioricanis]|uniref:Uncharacterized protein n=1 Tax=Porphyromonas crevioricanis JCM 15906 TaxID=1305617 RepID=T1CP62_9PORP|nr:hypothetical protein [Porphyromonas crevioricanis]KGN88904.1 hypothetical protein HQ45_09575 [Porphyromonas crevioricanis]GAD04923.1 hypothetical protein PORCRE_620 [Porphyromonas crevioricanis JCM 15906]SJZ74388.1 hypothetical protein SAMN02745203_00741 [Porphyromonas crevioricanis]